MDHRAKLIIHIVHGSNAGSVWRNMEKLLIIGYGNQAKSWALNLRDSEIDFSIGLRPNSSSWENSKKKGFSTISLNSDLSSFKNIVLLTPDDTHENILCNYSFKDNTNFYYAHGYSVTEKKLNEKFFNHNHILLAPKAIASELRFQYETDGKLGAVYSLEFVKPESKSVIKEHLFELAKNIGITSGPHLTTFKNETYADLFSEQTILCCVLPYVSNAVFNKLRQKGVEKETAYFEAWYEVKLIADTLIKIGPSEFFDLISPNALAGSEVGREAIINEQFNDSLDNILENIYSGKFQKLIDNTNFKDVRKNIKNYWDNQELSQVHERMKDDLFR